MSEEQKTSLIYRIADKPPYQAIVIFLFGGFLAFIDSGSNDFGVGTTEKNAPWILMTACLLFYALCCSLLSLRTKHMNLYWRDAIFSFMGLAVASALLATALSGQSMDEAGSFRWLFVVLAIGFLVFLTIVRLIRKIVEIAIKQDDKLRGE